MKRVVIVPQFLSLRIYKRQWKSFSLLMALTTSLFIFAEDSIDTGNSAKQIDAIENNLIYKTVDAQGRVSFGDQPGPDAVELETLERPRYEQNVSTQELQLRLEQMAATTKRLQEDRKLRSQLRQQEGEAKKTQYQAPTVVVEKRVYRSRSYPYLYNPHRRKGEKIHRSSSSLGLHLGGSRSNFHYGFSFGSRQRHSKSRDLQTPYRHEQDNIRQPGLLKRPQN